MFYSVRVGKCPGIYTSWEECKLQVIGFKGAKFKKFDSKAEALNFMENINSQIVNDTTIDKYINISNDNEYLPEIKVYTDGSCYGNGKPPSFGGYGIYFGDGLPNISNPVPDKPTNNKCELLAILHAIKFLLPKIKDNHLITIGTDSDYSIRCFTSYGDKCHKKQWKSKGDKKIPNVEIVKEGYYIVRKYPNIKFKHIYSHTGEQDPDSLANEHADKLAREGMLKHVNQSDEIWRVTFPSGKYKGKNIEGICKNNLDYALWYLNNIAKKKDQNFYYILKLHIQRLQANLE